MIIPSHLSHYCISFIYEFFFTKSRTIYIFEGDTMTYKTDDLPYAYDALEPYIDEETMHVHHDKHHVAYTTKLNAALEKHPKFFEKTAEEVLADLKSVPEDIRTTVRNNGGGHVNHNFFWSILGPDNHEPVGAIQEALEKTFGSLEAFKEQFTNAAATQFGSGWAWLVLDKGTLKIIARPNQDSPLSEGLVPLLAIDVWEHAYYLKYQNKRPDYITAFFNVIDWQKVNKKYEKALKQERYI